jgi:hypothetical protein
MLHLSISRANRALTALHKMWDSGEITTDQGDVIASPTMTPAVLRGSGLPLLPPAGRTGLGHERIDVGPVAVDGHVMYCALIFRDGRPLILHMELGPGEAVRLFGADQPTSAESAEARYYTNLIERMVGRTPPVTFPWGTIHSAWSPRDSNAGISINYMLS